MLKCAVLFLQKCYLQVTIQMSFFLNFLTAIPGRMLKDIGLIEINFHLFPQSHVFRLDKF